MRKTVARAIPCSRLAVAAVILVGALAASTAHAAVFGLLDTGELYTSTNGGVAWTVVSTLSANDAVGLAAGSSTSDLFLATRSGTVYHSSNIGVSWTAVGAISASDVAGFTINFDASLLLLTESGTLYRSTNGGTTFTALTTLTASNIVSLAHGPLGRLYSLTRTGEIYESQDQGASWTAVGSVTASNAVSIRRLVSSLYVLTETGEVFRSINYGRTWIPVGAITASNMTVIVDAGASLLAAAGTGEVYASSNGTTWSAVGAINQMKVVSLGSDTPLATGVETEDVTPRFVLRAPYPNPTTRSSGSTFTFETSTADRLRLEMYDIRGRLVAERSLDAFEFAGGHAISWQPIGLASGTYLVRAVSESGQAATVKWTIRE
jgi:hypothetical protein